MNEAKLIIVKINKQRSGDCRVKVSQTTDVVSQADTSYTQPGRRQTVWLNHNKQYITANTARQ